MRAIRLGDWAIAFAISCALMPGVGRAQAIVLQASGPSKTKFPIGSVLKKGAKIVLLARDVLSILEHNGTRNFKGPQQAEVGRELDDTNPTILEKLKRFARSPTEGRMGISGIAVSKRLQAPPPLEPNSVSFSPGNFYCLNLSDTPTVSGATPGSTLHVTRVNDGKTQTQSFELNPTERGQAPWPAPYPAQVGDVLSITSARASSAVTVKSVPQAPNILDLAIALDEAGCRSQANAVVLSTGLQGSSTRLGREKLIKPPRPSPR